jgi:hypothetical protein
MRPLAGHAVLMALLIIARGPVNRPLTGGSSPVSTSRIIMSGKGNSGKSRIIMSGKGNSGFDPS